MSCLLPAACCPQLLLPSVAAGPQLLLLALSCCCPQLLLLSGGGLLHKHRFKQTPKLSVHQLGLLISRDLLRASQDVDGVNVTVWGLSRDMAQTEFAAMVVPRAMR